MNTQDAEDFDRGTCGVMQTFKLVKEFSYFYWQEYKYCF